MSLQQQQQQYHNYEKQKQESHKQNQHETGTQTSEDYEEEQLKLEHEVLNILHQHQDQLNKYVSTPTQSPTIPSSEYSVVVNHAGQSMPGHSNTHLQQHANQKPNMETHNNEWHQVGHAPSAQPEYNAPTTHDNNDETVANNVKPHSHQDNTKTNRDSTNNQGKVQVPYHQNGHQIPLSMYDIKYEQNAKPEEVLSPPRPTLNELDIKAQIITGKPEKEPGSFHGNSQVLSIGKPTLLTPDGNNAQLSHSVGSSISFESKPHSVGSSITFDSKPHSISFESKPHSVSSSISFDSKPSPSEDNTIVSSDLRQKVKGSVQSEPIQPIIETNEIKQLQFTSNEVRPILPSDPTVATMNMDEKVPPPPRGKKPEVSSSKGQDDEVLGLSPPPVQTTRRPSYQEDIRPTTRRPLYRRPGKIPRPGPGPYKFEVPGGAANTTLTTKLEKPAVSTGKIEPVPKWQTSTTKKPINLLRPIEFQPGLVQSVRPDSGTGDGSYLKPEVIVAPSKVAMNDLKPVKPSVKPAAVSTGVGYQVVGKPIPADVVVSDKNPSTEWTSGLIIGSESEEPSSTSEYKMKTILSKTGQTTVFSNLYTKPATLKIKPTRTTVAHHSVISMVIDKDLTTEGHEPRPVEQPEGTSPEIVGVEVKEEDLYKVGNMQGSMTELPTRFVTHTQTLSVTITETTVVQSSGQKPSTHTLVLTKTHTSTMIDTVTEFHTLLKPTKILATVTTTVPVPVVQPTQYTPHFSGSAHPATARPDIITAPHPHPSKNNPHENESILLVVTDKKQGTVPLIERPVVDIQLPDETNEINPNDVLISGILTHSSDINDCRPECKVARNEECQRVPESNAMRCVCRPGFSRMFSDRPCKPTYSYNMKLVLDRNGKEKIRYTDTLQDVSSPGYLKLAAVTRDGLDRLVMQSELRDVYQGLEINRFDPALGVAAPVSPEQHALVNFHLQLSDNTEDAKLKDVLRKSLRHTNYSLGGTEVFAAREYLHNLDAEDFDECISPRYHDCSENAQCFNLKGTYTCSCKDGYLDASHNTQYPGRICSELTGCESCNYHGTCYTEGQNEIVCECFHWYTGEHCQVNLKVLLLGLLAAGVLLTILLLVCILLGGRRRQRPPTAPRALLKAQARHNAGFRRYIAPSAPLAGDKRAIVMNSSSSSEASVEVTPPPYVKQPLSTASHQRQVKMMARKGYRAPAAPSSGAPGSRTSTFRSEQRDRSLTVMIPRVKYRAPPPLQLSPPTPTSLVTMSTFGPEQKLLNYLTVERALTPDNKQASRASSRKPSNSTNHSTNQQIVHRKSTPPRKPSTGALVSAGFEVTATVGRTKELEEAYMGQPHQHDAQTFSTIRTNDSTSLLVPTLDTFLEDVITSRLDHQRNAALTVSEARSYDETTIQPPTRSYLHHPHPHYSGPGGGTDSKHSSSGKTNNDEGHTMVERDLGSTYLMPQRHLYKLDHSRQGSEGSNFDSL
uniref:63 kDa sperm flagellar membrane protein n=1 Tax=Cacopsylla melanoneura TaxID=428564 RepID=A0A8D8WRQ5_9HEMI